MYVARVKYWHFTPPNIKNGLRRGGAQAVADTGAREEVCPGSFV